MKRYEKNSSVLDDRLCGEYNDGLVCVAADVDKEIAKLEAEIERLKEKLYDEHIDHCGTMYTFGMFLECKTPEEIEELAKHMKDDFENECRRAYTKALQRIKELEDENEHLRAFTEDRINEYINKEK